MVTCESYLLLLYGREGRAREEGGGSLVPPPPPISFRSPSFIHFPHFLVFAEGQFIAMHIGNMSNGIKYPSIFDLPSYCKTEKKCTPAKYESSQIGLMALRRPGSDNTLHRIRQRISVDSSKNTSVLVQEISGAPFDVIQVVYQDHTNVRTSHRS